MSPKLIGAEQRQPAEPVSALTVTHSESYHNSILEVRLNPLEMLMIFEVGPTDVAALWIHVIFD